MHLEHLVTEQPNGQSANLDALGIGEALALMNREDAGVAAHVAHALPAIASGVAVIADALRAGGRLIYIGAGNSGRIGYLDALECQPTFGTQPGEIIGIVAGGFAGITESVEDSDTLGRQDLDAAGLARGDVVVGLTASGRTPYVLGALRHARDTGCRTIAVACNVGSEAAALADVAIEVDCGPEVLTGSTRLKAGTAQKMICNMLSTISMVALGKTYGNLMVDVQVHNHKLRQRAIGIVSQAAGVPTDVAARALEQAGDRPRIAILMLRAGVDRAGAERLADAAGGSIRKALATLAPSARE